MVDKKLTMSPGVFFTRWEAADRTDAVLQRNQLVVVVYCDAIPVLKAVFTNSFRGLFILTRSPVSFVVVLYAHCVAVSGLVAAAN